jgi:hypothetical protein
MTSEMVFLPPRRNGLILHILLVFVLTFLSMGGLVNAFQQQNGSYFTLLIIFSMILFPFAFLFAYRAYALSRARYAMDREGLRLQWGLRIEDIPLLDIIWIHPANELGYRLPLPFMPLPGAILGKRRVEGLGTIEFMASSRSELLLIATSQDIFAISPVDPLDFQQSFQQTMEMGSITPILRQSTQPAMFLQMVWGDRAARILILTGFIMTMILLIIDSLLIPTRVSISLGFNSQGFPLNPGPSQRLMLLPVLAILVFSIDFFIGLFFYRKPENRPAAYMMWSGGILMPILFILATFFLT